MSCEPFRDGLIDLLYGELPESESESQSEGESESQSESESELQAVQRHVNACPACRAELARLRYARKALAEALASGPAAGAFDPEKVPAHRQAEQVPGRPPDPKNLQFRDATRRWWRLGAGVAAAAAIMLAVWLAQIIVPPAQAESRPVEIQRVGVSLTILSQPEGWTAFVPAQPGPQQAPFINDQVQTAFAGPAYRWPGMALVRDQRVIRHLKAGSTEVRFGDVPADILPDTVRLRSLDAPEGLTILEQNYQYDLASADAVLRRHIDRPVAAVFKDGQTVAGTLLSFDRENLVVRPEGAGPRTISRGDLRAITFAALPEGLLARPTLVWQLQNRAAARQQFEVAYLTHGLTWRADYVLKLRPGTRKAPGALAAAEDGPAIEDVADLVGYATVGNFSGVTYEDAQLKLLAGDVNIIRPEVAYDAFSVYSSHGTRGLGVLVMTEKSFFEYHLYTLTHPTTIRHAEVKQLEMVSGAGLRMRRGYVYDPREHVAAPRVVGEIVNSEKNGLGRPLPKGLIRLYAPDPEGQQTFVAATTIDHTPRDEKLRLPWGHAFDIACTGKGTQSSRSQAEYWADWAYQVRNHKDYDVTVTIMVNVHPTAYKAECGHRWHVREVGKVEIEVPVKAGQQADVSFQVHWNTDRGGGLKSPYDQ